MTTEQQMLSDDKMRAEIAHLIAQTAEIQQRMKYQIWLIGAAYVGALVAIVKVL